MTRVRPVPAPPKTPAPAPCRAGALRRALAASALDAVGCSASVYDDEGGRLYLDCGLIHPGRERGPFRRIVIQHRANQRYDVVDTLVTPVRLPNRRYRWDVSEVTVQRAVARDDLSAALHTAAAARQAHLRVAA